MNTTATLFSLFFTLLLCVLNFYSMNSILFTTGRTYLYYSITFLVCLIGNSMIIVRWGISTFYTLMLFTVGIPFFLAILAFAKSKVSQLIFTVWLWISFYSLIQFAAEIINHFTFKSTVFFSVLRIIFLCAYFVVYNRFFKTSHRRFMETSNINWWLFSFIPLVFTFLIWVTNFSFEKYKGSTDNYFVNTVIYILMLLVYSMIVYAFNIVQSSTENKLYAQNVNKQISTFKKQYDLQLQREELERIYRHDQRFKNSIIVNYLDSGDIESAKAYIAQQNIKMSEVAPIILCENPLINATLSEYRSKVLQKGLKFSASVQMPESISCEEAEFCVMLSNFLENSLEAANEYISIKIKHFNSQLSISIENDYNEELKKDSEGWYITTKPQGSGLGLKSANMLLKKNRGFLKIEAENGVFKLFATMKN